MISLKKVAALGLAALMTFSMPLTAMASGTTTITEGTGNVLDYNVEDIVVPTKILVAFNPNNYELNKSYTRVKSGYDKDETYFVKSGSKFVVAASHTSSQVTAEIVDGANGSLYKPVVSTDQIVSLNYAIYSKANKDRNITLNFTAKYPSAAADVVSTKNAIEFVDVKTKAQAEVSANDGGAKRDELKLFLEAATAATGSKIGAQTFDNPAQVSTASATYSGPYYVKSGSAYSYVDSAAAVTAHSRTKNSVFVETSGYISKYTTAEELVDTTMTVAQKGTVVFSAEPNASSAASATVANASVAFKLDKATWAMKDDEYLDFDTTQAGLGDKLEMTDVNGVAAFTLQGAMNEDADWTKARVSKIVIKPVYEIKDSDKSETIIDGTLNQIPSIEEGSVIFDANTFYFGIAGGDGFAKAFTPTKVTLTEDGGIPRDVTAVAEVVEDSNMYYVGVSLANATAAEVDTSGNDYVMTVTVGSKKYVWSGSL